MIDASGRNRHVLARKLDHRLLMPAWSPDSRAIAIFTADDQDKNRFHLRLLDVVSGRTRVLPVARSASSYLEADKFRQVDSAGTTWAPGTTSRS